VSDGKDLAEIYGSVIDGNYTPMVVQLRDGGVEFDIGRKMALLRDDELRNAIERLEAMEAHLSYGPVVALHRRRYERRCSAVKAHLEGVVDKLEEVECDCIDNDHDSDCHAHVLDEIYRAIEVLDGISSVDYLWREAIAKAAEEGNAWGEELAKDKS
jgi:hypothetical protein